MRAPSPAPPPTLADAVRGRLAARTAQREPSTTPAPATRPGPRHRLTHPPPGVSHCGRRRRKLGRKAPGSCTRKRKPPAGSDTSTSSKRPAWIARPRAVRSTSARDGKKQAKPRSAAASFAALSSVTAARRCASSCWDVSSISRNVIRLRMMLCSCGSKIVLRMRFWLTSCDSRTHSEYSRTMSHRPTTMSLISQAASGAAYSPCAPRYGRKARSDSMPWGRACSSYSMSGASEKFAKKAKRSATPPATSDGQTFDGSAISTSSPARASIAAVVPSSLSRCSESSTRRVDRVESSGWRRHAMPASWMWDSTSRAHSQRSDEGSASRRRTHPAQAEHTRAQAHRSAAEMLSAEPSNA
mmetsp:Transcript_16615/g.55272  ORF Transcript_16615/g.55272 Transcript_16615/m.55272 type:complete len:356 (-) Transcript_16615:247-1314(-)